MSGGGRSGFMLVEALVALAVLATALAAITGGLLVARRAVEAAAARAEAADVAGELVEAPAARAYGPGRLAGELRGLAYTIDAKPLDLPLAPAGGQPDYAPLRLTITVRDRTGRLFALETVRLAAAARS